MIGFSFRARTARSYLHLWCATLISIQTLSCSQSPQPPAATVAEVTTSSVPPFQTKEPERYRATRVTTTTEQSPNASSSQSGTTRVWRDGVNRREEYGTTAGAQLVYLQNSQGWFILVPTLKVYSDALSVSRPNEQMRDGDILHMNPTGDLLQVAQGAASYRKLGTEQFNNRPVTKYLVQYPAPSNETDSTQDTLIWIDDALGLPVRSDSTYEEAGVSYRVIVELREIAFDVDGGVFQLPGDYEKVENDDLLKRIRRHP